MFALFHTKTGNLVCVYETEIEARVGLRNANNNIGYSHRISRCWTNGYEIEYCKKAKANFVYVQEHGPYAITEYSRWERMLHERKFDGNNKSNKKLDDPDTGPESYPLDYEI